MKTLSFFSGSARAPKLGALALVLLPFVAGAPLGCSGKDETNVDNAGLQPGNGGSSGGDGDGSDQGGSAGDGQSGSAGGSSGEGTGGSNLSTNGGSGSDVGGSSGAGPAPECITFDNAERVPLYDGTTLPPLN